MLHKEGKSWVDPAKVNNFCKVRIGLLTVLCSSTSSRTSHGMVCLTYFSTLVKQLVKLNDIWKLLRPYLILKNIFYWIMKEKYHTCRFVTFCHHQNIGFVAANVFRENNKKNHLTSFEVLMKKKIKIIKNRYKI